MGHVEYRTVRIIPGIKTEYSIDSSCEKGSFHVYLKNGGWNIGYEFKAFGYIPFSGHLKFVDIYPDDSRLTRGRWKVGESYCSFKIITHSTEEAERAEELIGPKIIKNIPEATIEYYRKDKILKIPLYNDEIRINIKNENLEYIRNNKKIVKVFPLNEEIHFYGIEPEEIK